MLMNEIFNVDGVFLRSWLTICSLLSHRRIQIERDDLHGRSNYRSVRRRHNERRNFDATKPDEPESEFEAMYE